MIFDVVIVSHEFDFNKLKFIIKNIDINLPDAEEIHLILSERERYLDNDIIEKLTNKKIFYHIETEVLKIDKDKIKHRRNWIYQMMLKFFQNVTKNDNYLIIEADTVILKKLEFFQGEKTIFYLGMNQYHEPNFNFMNKVFNLNREYNHSFISELMMYNKKIIRDILYKSKCNSIQDFLNLVYNNVDNNSYPADYEIYGNFCYKYYKDKYIIQKLNSKSVGRYGNWTDEEIEEFINTNKQYDTVSFHTYKAGIEKN